MSTFGLVVDLDATVGAMVIGSTFAVFLFGIVSLQAHMYYQTFKDDKWYLKTMVALVWALELGHTFCVMAEIYKATITHYGQPDKLFPFPYLGASTSVGGAIAVLVHTFFSARVWRVLPKPFNYIGAFCFFIAVVRFVGSIVLGINAVKATTMIDYRNDWGWLIMALLIVGAAIDIIIASSMMGYLVKQRERVFKRTASMIDRLIQYAVCTGLLTSCTAIAVLIAYVAGPDLLVWVAVYSILSKLYSNSLLAALNGRDSLRSTTSGALISSSQDRDVTTGHLTTRPTHETSGSTANPASPRTLRLGRSRDLGDDAYPGTISVEMKTTVHADYDAESDPEGPAYNASKSPRYRPSAQPWDVSFPPVMEAHEMTVRGDRKA